MMLILQLINNLIIITNVTVNQTSALKRRPTSQTFTHPLSLIHPSTYSSIHPLIHPSIHSSIHPSTYSSIYSFSLIHASIHPSIYPLTHPSTLFHSPIRPLLLLKPHPSNHCFLFLRLPSLIHPAISSPRLPISLHPSSLSHLYSLIKPSFITLLSSFFH